MTTKPEAIAQIEAAQRIASEYGTKDSQIDSGNLYFALRQCLDHIAAQDAEIARLRKTIFDLLGHCDADGERIALDSLTPTPKEPS